jgi:hypothetical protein
MPTQPFRLAAPRSIQIEVSPIAIHDLAARIADPLHVWVETNNLTAKQAVAALQFYVGSLAAQAGLSFDGHGSLREQAGAMLGGWESAKQVMAEGETPASQAANDAPAIYVPGGRS